jgi:hypothetical protein
MNEMYSQAIQTITNALYRQLPAGDLTEEQKTTVSKMEIVQNEEWRSMVTHNKSLLVQTEGKMQVGHYGTESWGWRR